MTNLTPSQIERLLNHPAPVWLRGLNLSGVDLAGPDLAAANLTGATLSAANLREAHLGDPELMGATMPDGSRHE